MSYFVFLILNKEFNCFCFVFDVSGPEEVHIVFSGAKALARNPPGEDAPGHQPIF